MVKIVLLILGICLVLCEAQIDCGHSGLCPHVKRLSPPNLERRPPLPWWKPQEPPSLCGNFCTNDNQCKNDEKCCPNNCGYSCKRAVYILP